MSVRMATVRARTALRRNLPLYAWFEDVFSIRAERHGRIVAGALVVHLGTKTGLPGRKLGYAQIANLVYLVRKGVLRDIPLRYMSRHVASNVVNSLFPQPGPITRAASSAILSQCAILP